jgi:hypothetical protein
MTIMERSGNKFEKAWRDLFDEAEVQPREEVWAKIDSKLANHQIRRYRRKILIYKLLAAASILFAIGIGYFSIQINRRLPENINGLSVVQEMPEKASGVQEDSIAGVGKGRMDEVQTVTESDDIQKENMIATIPEISTASQTKTEMGKTPEENEQVAVQGISTTEVTDPQNKNILFSGEKTEDTDLMVLSGNHIVSDRESKSLSYLTNRFNPVDEPPAVDVPDPQKKKDPYADDWYTLYEETRITEEEDNDHNGFWAGVNFSSGVFDPNISYGSNPGSLADQVQPASGSSFDQLSMVPDPSNNIANYMKATQPEESSYNPEFSYAYGVNVGYQISPKFMVRGGLSYLSSHTSTSINSYINNPATNKKMPNQALYSVSIESAGVTTVNTTTEEIQLNNTYEFISLPLSFGYYLVDKKIEWMLTAGVTTDFFLKNTISDPSNFLEPKEITAGSGSPYNNSYFNGTLGTMVNFSFADHYRFSLEPTYRLGLSDFAKDDALFTSRPSTFFITAGLSYIFK